MECVHTVMRYLHVEPSMPENATGLSVPWQRTAPLLRRQLPMVMAACVASAASGGRSVSRSSRANARIFASWIVTRGALAGAAATRRAMSERAMGPMRAIAGRVPAG